VSKQKGHPAINLSQPAFPVARVAKNQGFHCVPHAIMFSPSHHLSIKRFRITPILTYILLLLTDFLTSSRA
jgi:hypothetical protein